VSADLVRVALARAGRWTRPPAVTVYLQQEDGQVDREALDRLLGEMVAEGLIEARLSPADGMLEYRLPVGESVVA